MAPNDAVLTILQPTCRLADPHQWTDTRDFLNLRQAVYEGLARLGAEGGFEPALAEGWTVDADARTWTFRLRPGVRFHDDKPVTAEAVVAALDRARGPGVPGELGTTGLYRSYLGDARVEALGPLVVRVVTAAPAADLLDLLVEIPVVSQVTLAGTGRYRVADSRDDEVIMEAAPGYWAQVATHGRLRWRAERDPAGRVSIVEQGGADLVTEVSPPGEVAADDVRIVSQAGKVAVVFMCNCASGPCADRRVRRALNQAIDVPAMVRVVKQGAAMPLNGPLTPSHFGYDPAVLPYRRDVAAARASLQESGFGDGLEITLDVPMRLPDEAMQLAEQMAVQYADAGISAQVRSFSDRPAYAEMVKAKQIDDACCFDSSPLSTWRVLREKFHSGVRGAWWQGYANPDVDRLLDLAARTVDNAIRQEHYRQAYRIIRDDAPWIFLYSPTLYWAVGPRASGVNFGPDGVMRLP